MNNELYVKNAANVAAAKYMEENYTLTAHNCYQLGPKAIIDAINKMRSPEERIDISDDAIPIRAFETNNEWGAIPIQLE